MWFVILLLFGGATASLAVRKNRNPLIWGALGFFTHVIAIGILLCLRPGHFNETANQEKNGIEPRKEYDRSLLDVFGITEFAKNNSTIDVVGVAIAAIITVSIVIAYLNLGVAPGLILSGILLWKAETIKRLWTKPGFGAGMVVYGAYIIAAGFVQIMAIKSMSLGLNIVCFLLAIVGGFFVHKVNDDAKIAAPFMAMLLTVGILFFRLDAASSNNDMLAGGDSSDTVLPADAEIASATASYDLASTEMAGTIDTTTVAFAPPAAPFETISYDTSAASDSTLFTTQGQDTLFNAQAASPNVEYQLSDSSAMHQGSIITDGDTSRIYDHENTLLGTMTNDGSTSVLRDTQQNTILTRDSSDFVLAPDGTPLAHIENSGLVQTIRDTQTGEITYKDEISGIIRDSEGKVLGRISKK